MTPAVNYAYLPYATNYAYETPAAQVVAASPVVAQASPVVAQASPVVAAAPVESVAGTPYDATNTQYHAQDDIGQFNYGYSNPLSTKQELLMMQQIPSIMPRMTLDNLTMATAILSLPNKNLRLLMVLQEEAIAMLMPMELFRLSTTSVMPLDLKLLQPTFQLDQPQSTQ